ncbi:hypothetical protein FQR65_LT13804 [Abscondita terminalis]|nr:hypothetical protein FQR65_LT13804 [Abscondita terminalis]
MEERWYLGPGQVMEKTKIRDRGRGLHVTRDAWKKIIGHLDRNRLKQEAIDKDIQDKLALKKGSEDMTKTWDNSLENITKRKEEQRLARVAKEEQEKLERFYRLRNEQENVRQKYIKEAKKKIYLTKGYPKSLTSALILTEVLNEREKQIELERKISKHEMEEEANEAMRIKECALQEEKEKEEEKQKIHKQKMEIRNQYLSEINNNEEMKRKKREDRIKAERMDVMNMEKEMARIKQIEEEQEQELKSSIQKETSDFMKQQKRNKEIMRLEDLEQDNIIKIYSTAKHKIDCMRKKKENDIQKDLQLRRNAASKKILDNADAKAIEEERIFKKSIEERERQEIEKLKAEKKHLEELKQERIEDRINFLKKEEQMNFEKHEAMKWEMLNRFKTNDVIKEYNQQKAEKEWQKKMHVRKYLFEQMDENEEIKKKLKEKEDKEYRDSLEKAGAEDVQFFEYADEVISYAKEKNKPTAIIERCVNNYRRENNLPIPYYKTKCE